MKIKRMLYRKKSLPSDEDLYVAAHYFFNNVDGVLFYKIDPRHPTCNTSKMVGREIKVGDGHGYYSCRLLGHTFKVHQIVWLMHHRELPKMPIDHANRIKIDNRIENLRLATDRQNSWNQSICQRQYAGVEKPRHKNIFIAKITINGKKKYLGSFATPEEANGAYRSAKRELSGSFSPV